MTPEELLRDRYKVIDPYPCSPYKVGDIIAPGENQTNVMASEKYQYAFFMPVTELEKMPNIFQPLPWYAERELSDMPGYVKCDERVWKITEWKKDMVGRFFPMNEIDAEGESENFANIKWHFCAEKFLPCTSEEYNEWKQSNK